MPVMAASPAEPTAANREAPPNSSNITPKPYQIQASPMRVAIIIHRRIQRGARQRFIRRMTRWSRRSICAQRLRATAIAYLATTALPLTHSVARGLIRKRLVASTGQAGLEARVHIPQHSRVSLCPFEGSCPFFAEANLVQPVARGERRYQHRERR